MKKELKSKMFDQEDCNALMSALIECAGSEDDIYTFLEETPKTSLVVEIVQALKKLGYKISHDKNK